MAESAQAIATSGCVRRSRSSGWRSPPNRSRPRTFRQAVRTSTGLDRPVHDDDLPSLHRFASHLERDLDAVVAGLTLPWDPGVVERHVGQIKMLKRQMFGRASFALLRPGGPPSVPATPLAQLRFPPCLPLGDELFE
ncbi:hypothetical protein ACFYRG_52465 [Streptomyces mirabilis]|uniref:hypothetical protein n=1 Tax=Streptomyces mirabilis TaxID=68239 RepID=UPI00368BB65A